MKAANEPLASSPQSLRAGNCLCWINDQDRAFIHYEEGGIAHSYIVEFFRLKSTDVAVGLWSGHCGAAKNLEEMKRLVSKEDCESCCNR